MKSTDEVEVKGEGTSYKGNAADESHLIFGSVELYEQTLMFVHQEKWQQELLQKYGNVIAMIDAPYRML